MTKFRLAMVLAVTSWPAIAQAQVVDPEEGLEPVEIIVTAQKREQRLQDVPISISVQTGATLENQGISQFIDLQTRVPNLSITDTPANASIFIRGIGTSGNNLSFEQSVALFVDQVYGGRNRQFMQPFFDVERVEVLRGPQGALFGRNTSAGAISVITRRPSSTFEGDMLVDYEFERGSHSLQLGAGGPITDELSVRFATRYSDDKGWLDNIVLDRKEPVREDILTRLSLLWEPTDGFSLFGKVEYGDSKIIGAPFEFVPAGSEPDYEVNTDDAFAPLRDLSDSFNATIEANLDIGDHTLTSISAYSQYDYGQAFNIQARSPARLVTQNFEDFEQYSQELRLASPAGGPIDYIVGGYIEHSKSDVDRISLISLPFPPLLNRDNRRTFEQETDVMALFGQVNWRPIDQITLGVGLRWTDIEKDGSVSGIEQTLTPPGGVIVTPRPSFDATFSKDELSPTVNLLWQPNRSVNLYARYAEGSKGGAFTEAAETFDEFVLDPEQSESFEIGGKFQFPALEAYLNIAAFTTDYSDLQKSTLDIDTATFVTSNAAGARTRGIEVDAGIRPFRGVSVTASGAYLDAYYTSYPQGPCRFDAPPGCEFQDREGDRLQNAPEWTGNINIDVDRPLTDTLDWVASWTTTYQSDINFQDFADPTHVQEAFSKTDVRVGVEDNDDLWQVAFLVKNLFDVETSTIIFSTFPVGVGPLDRVHLPAPRRSYTLQVRARF